MRESGSAFMSQCLGAIFEFEHTVEHDEEEGNEWRRGEVELESRSRLCLVSARRE